MMQLILKIETDTTRGVLIPDLPEEGDRVSLNSRFFLNRNPAFLGYLAGAKITGTRVSEISPGEIESSGHEQDFPKVLSGIRR